MPQPVSRFAQLLATGQLRRAVGARTQRLAPTGVDVELLDAADRALAARVPLAVVNPVPGGAAAVSLAAATVLRAMLNRAEVDVRVAACSSALADRALYDQLSFRGQRLAAMVSRARVAAGGVITVIGGNDAAAAGRLYLSADAARILPLLDTVEAVVVDASSVDDDTFAILLDNSRRRAPLIYLTTNPTDGRLSGVRAAGGLVWSWDAPSLGRLAQPVSAVPTSIDPPPPLLAATATLATVGVSTTVVHIPPAATDLDDGLAQLWVALGQLGTATAAAGADPVMLRGVWWARGVFNALALLPVAPTRYDRHVGNNPYALTLTTAADTARQYASHARRGTRDTWAAVAAAIRAAITAAGDAPRTPALIRVTADAADSRTKTAILVRNRTAAAALRAALRESPDTPLGWERSVDVLGLEQLTCAASSSVWQAMYLAGTLPHAYATVLATPSARRLHLLACGPREGTRAVRQAVAARAALAQLRRETVEVSAPRLSLPLRAAAVDEHPADAVSMIEHDIERALTAEEATAIGDAWEPFTVDVLAILATVRASDDAGPHTTPRHDPHGATEIVTIYLDETGTGERAALLAAPNDLLTRRSGLETAPGRRQGPRRRRHCRPRRPRRPARPAGGDLGQARRAIPVRCPDRTDRPVARAGRVGRADVRYDSPNDSRADGRDHDHESGHHRILDQRGCRRTEGRPGRHPIRPRRRRRDPRAIRLASRVGVAHHALRGPQTWAVAGVPGRRGLDQFRRRGRGRRTRRPRRRPARVGYRPRRRRGGHAAGPLRARGHARSRAARPAVRGPGRRVHRGCKRVSRPARGTRRPRLNCTWPPKSKATDTT